MGCHMWLYKKVTSFNKDELNKKLEEFIDSESKTWIGKTPREEYAKEMFEDLPHDLICYENNPSFCEVLKERYGSLDKCRKIWDDWHEKFNKTKERVNNWISSSEIDENEFVSIIKEKGITCDIKEHKGEYYLHTIFDTYFRNYHYGDGPIDNYEDMIKYLEATSPDMTHQYGTFDENGVFYYFNPETYESKKGVTEELKDMLKFLYKDNDIFIYFG